MKKITTLLLALLGTSLCFSQTNPAITSWLQNSSVKGSHYMQGNPMVIQDNVLANVQKVQYASNWVYVSTSGIPSYPTGPFLDGNPSLATNQNAIYKLPLNPTPKVGTPTPTNLGNIGIFINGVSLFDYRDGVGWNSTSNSLCGGPGNPPCPGGPMASTSWNRDAIPAEKAGFDCSKGHPAMGNYHHHQNPSAFKLDLNVISSICNLYDADGLYSIDSTQHAPLIGFAYDGYPIYGAYAYKNSDGTGGITRMKSGYQLRDITNRTHWADGTDVPNGPPVNGTYFLGYFREDYEWLEHPNQADFLDIHNGRFCVTPEYPDGTYAYFATVDENWNSAFPYVVGPTFFGTVTGTKVAAVTEPVTIYPGGSVGLKDTPLEATQFMIFPNPTQDLIAIQMKGLVSSEITLLLTNEQGVLVQKSSIPAGSTISFLDIQTLYDGTYFLTIVQENQSYTKPIILLR